MGTRRYTINRGQRSQQVVEAAGGALGTDVIQLNVDFNLMTKGEMLEHLEELIKRIHERPWPPS